MSVICMKHLFLIFNTYKHAYIHTHLPKSRRPDSYFERLLGIETKRIAEQVKMEKNASLRENFLSSKKYVVQLMKILFIVEVLYSQALLRIT